MGDNIYNQDPISVKRKGLNSEIQFANNGGDDLESHPNVYVTSDGGLNSTYFTGDGGHLSNVIGPGNVNSLAYFYTPVKITSANFITIDNSVPKLTVDGDLTVNGNLHSVDHVTTDDAIILLANNKTINPLASGIMLNRPGANVFYGVIGDTNNFAIGLTNDPEKSLSITMLDSEDFKANIYGSVVIKGNNQLLFTDNVLINTETSTYSRIAIGNQAGSNLQQVNSISIGNQAGKEKQKTGSVAIGGGAGSNAQQMYSVSVGTLAGYNTQNYGAVAIGFEAGKEYQQQGSVAIGARAGKINQQTTTVAIGHEAGSNFQLESSVAIGNQAGKEYQNTSALAIGTLAGNNNQGIGTIAIGYHAGKDRQKDNSLAIGVEAGSNVQLESSVAIGYQAGKEYQNTHALAIGTQAGENNQKEATVALGYQAGNDNQWRNAIAVGKQAGANSQRESSIAIGTLAGYDNQLENAIAIGQNAGQNNQNTNSIAIGVNASQHNQGSGSISIGAESNASGDSAIAIGPNSNANTSNTIVLNASATELISTSSDATYINPIRHVNTASNVLTYNKTSKEVTDVGMNINLGTPLEKQVLQYNGTEWINDWADFTTIKATANVELNKGDVVYVYDGQGDHPIVDKADASYPTKMPAIGVILANTAPNAECDVVTFGVFTMKIPTDFNPHEVLYVSNTVPGGLSNIKPTSVTSPDLIQNIGICIKGGNGGKLLITGVGRANDIPNAQILPDETSVNYVYVNTSGNDLKKIDPQLLTTNVHTLEQVTSVGNTTSNTVYFQNDTLSFKADSSIEVGTANLFVDTTTGRVGIGTDDPGVRLHVKSSSSAVVKYESDTTGIYNEYTSTNGTIGYIGDGSQTVSSAPATAFGIQASQGDFIVATGGNQEKFRLTSGGKVGIGTDDPSNELHIKKQNDGGDVGIRIQNTSTAPNSNSVIAFTNTPSLTAISSYISCTRNNNNLLLVADPASGNVPIYIQKTGEIGLGTFTPISDYRVHIPRKVGSSGNMYLEGNSAETGAPKIAFYDGNPSATNTGIFGFDGGINSFTIDRNLIWPWTNTATYEVGADQRPFNVFSVLKSTMVFKGADATAVLSGEVDTQAMAGGDVLIRGGLGVANPSIGVFSGDVTIAGGETTSGVSGGAGKIYLKTGGTSTTRLRIDEFGSVYMGDPTMTQYPLNIEASTSGPQIKLTRVNAYADIFMGGDTTTDSQLYIRSGGIGGVRLNYAATAWISASDANIKNINSELTNCVDKLENIRAVKYNFKDDDTSKEHIGVIAQEVEVEFPELVSESQIDGTKGVNYSELIPVLIGAIKELKAEIEVLKSYHS